MVRESAQELDIESAVRARYSGAALAREPQLCCPVSYEPALLAALPEEVLARDYGCGDPSRHLRPGEDCVLNLVKPADKARLFGELSRVLKRGGRVVISDIVSDEDVPLDLQRDSDLWSGCISGAFLEDCYDVTTEAAPIVCLPGGDCC